MIGFNKNSDYNEISDDLLLAEEEQDLPPQIKEKKAQGRLKTGYTTGTSASAATKAALLTLITHNNFSNVLVTLPKGDVAKISIFQTKINSDSVMCSVIKDGGDDPDVTHGAEICSTVSLVQSENSISIDGGSGVGRVTKPGLGLEIGKAAINPVPMKMIYNSINDVLLSYPNILKQNEGIRVIISVPNGAEIAKKTDNPRLGIMNGISILGTTGIVLPYSTASFAASIRQSLDVGIALNSDTFILTTGGRSEDYCKNLFGNTYPDHAYVQMGDFAGYSVKQCHQKNVKAIIIGGFIGKLTKIAMGVKQTHVRGSHVDLEFMSNLARQLGIRQEIIDQIKMANTARHVSEIIDSYHIPCYYDLICKYAGKQLQSYSNNEIKIRVIMFSFDGIIIGEYPKIISTTEV